MSVDIAGAGRSLWKLMKLELSESTVAFISCRGRLWKLQFHQFSSWSICSGDVYRQESGRYCSLPFFLIYFWSFYLLRFSFYINNFTYKIWILASCSSNNVIYLLTCIHYDLGKARNSLSVRMNYHYVLVINSNDFHLSVAIHLKSHQLPFDYHS